MQLRLKVSDNVFRAVGTTHSNCGPDGTPKAAARTSRDGSVASRATTPCRQAAFWRSRVLTLPASTCR